MNTQERQTGMHSVDGYIKSHQLETNYKWPTLPFLELYNGLCYVHFVICHYTDS